MRGCLAGADNPANLLPRYRVWLWPSVDDKQEHSPDYTHSLPAVSVGMGIKAADGKLFVKNEFCSLEAQAVSPSVDPVFLILPNPTHTVSIGQSSYSIVATTSAEIKPYLYIII
jgi:hypothetical protein